ncbi:GGDEF domain-containing protein [Ihubacter massiliensis]|uniref:GGDEF domain-containing protein n=1 Tax=Hominibacterium faecale TaxID=2839743 RepID=A0A9J6QWR3_9FIRM|nr:MULTISPECIES: GGDEF domain-containing protein [Eubacteriales Family XIII. Incertae Sedis]MCC2864951.1 GGDEF domain-containing protein [Anaerovorax odorimutans]MCI7303284.1 GGDEF domain-containing protein [Clostridia bacterium]MDY3011964.1 GGDEF domain-containing protein [Clostridiales Family XIII bacterium]MCO7120628.1 GGDEF domain-containing protein [Ihubacter massiliensis]MCU7379929.1 GGDEF domain-containing protein [Hominibacterium faecale]
MKRQVWIGPRIWKSLKAFQVKNRKYITENREDIAEKNRTILKRISLLYSMVLIGYAIMAFFVFKSPELDYVYLFYISLQICFDLVLIYQDRSKKLKYRTVSCLCVIFCLLVMAFIITVSIYPFPEKPAIYFPTALVALSVLFVFTFAKLAMMQIGFAAVFLVIDHGLKTADAYSYDAFATAAALIIGLICAYIVTDLRLKEYKVKVQLQRLSSIDSLTGLYNKRMTQQLCSQYLKQKEGQPQGVLFILDLDDFKGINDQQGHMKGDLVLTKIGKCLRECFREEDILGRIGGDEFLAFMVGTSDRKVAETRAELVIDAVSKVKFDASSLQVTCSVGIAVCGGEAMDFNQLFARADKAMYYAKLRGKDEFVVWQDEAEQMC